MLFKYVYDHGAPKESQDDSLKRYCGSFDQSIDIENYREIIEDVELTYIAPNLSTAFYEELVTAYNGTPSAPQADIIRLLQPAIAYFTYFQAINLRSVFVSDMGPGQGVSKDGTFIFPSKWRAQATLRSAFQTANRRLARALSFLDLNADDYPTFKNSTAFDDSRRFFFNSVRELQPFLPMEAGQVVWNTLKVCINEAEQRYIYRLIGGTFFDELKTAIKDGSLTDDQKTLIDKIRWALVKWMRICAIPNLRLRFNENNLVEPDFGPDGIGYDGKAPQAEPIRSLWVTDQFAAREFLADLQSWLWQNASLFPTFMNSDIYDEEVPPTAFMDDFNQDSSGIVSLL